MGRKAEHNRQRILETADRLIYRRGYGNTSFADIAGESGIPKGNFYYYYKVKDGLLQDVLAQRRQAIRRQLDGWDDEFPTPRARLRRFVAMLRDNVQDLSRYGCPMGSLNSELGKDAPALQTAALAMFDLYREWLRAQFAGAPELADHLLAMAQGASLLGLAYGDPDLIERECGLMEQWLEQVLKP